MENNLSRTQEDGSLVFPSLVFLWCIIICVFLSSCCFFNLPYNQANTKWQTEDGRFTFYVTSSNKTYGKIISEEQTYYVELLWNPPLFITEVTYYDGKDSRMYWDKVRYSNDETYNNTVTCKIENNLLTDDKIKVSIKGEALFGLENSFTLKRVAENISYNEVEYPPIKLPEYYSLYEEYNDLFDKQLETFSEFETKYGKCQLASYHESLIDDETKYIIDNYYYVAEVDENNKPTYFIEILRHSATDKISAAYLIKTGQLPEVLIQLSDYSLIKRQNINFKP